MSKREKDQEQKAAQAASEHAESAEVPEDIVPEEPAAGTQDPLSEELEHLKASLSAKEEQYLRLAAEYDNFRKRSQKEKESIYADAKAINDHRAAEAEAETIEDTSAQEA